MKHCNKCGVTKPKTEFYKDAIKRDGLSSSCKSCRCIAAAAYRVANPEKTKEAQDRWSASNPDRVKAIKAKWTEANREKVNATQAAYRASHPDKVKARIARWQAANIEVTRIHVQNRRARKRANGGMLSKGLADKLFALQRGKCACCGEQLGDDYHLDHIMPIALGGSNTDDNIQLLRAICNHQKNAKHPIDFMQQRGFLL